MRIKLWYLALFLALAVPACRPSGDPGPSTEQADSSVRALLAIQDSVVSAEDLDGFMQLIAEDAAFLAPDEIPLQGKEAIRTWYGNLFRAFDVQMEHVPGPTEVQGSVLIHRGDARGTLRPRAGGAPISFDNKYLFVMRVDDDGTPRHWRAMFNANPPAANEQ